MTLRTYKMFEPMTGPGCTVTIFLLADLDNMFLELRLSLLKNLTILKYLDRQISCKPPNVLRGKQICLPWNGTTATNRLCTHLLK